MEKPTFKGPMPPSKEIVSVVLANSLALLAVDRKKDWPPPA
jgi:hypothetical protein